MRFITALVICFFIATLGNALEIDYSLTNPGSDYPEYEITLSGKIVPGDAIAFENIARDILHCFGQEIPCEVIMESPGGSLIEGLKIALILHDNGLQTRVQSGAECSSACAFMFLGGTVMGVVGNRVPSRTLEPFAQLGFHGFSVGEERSEDVDLNQSLEMSRDLTALVFEVMLDIGNIDLNWLAQVMNVPSWSMYYAVSPYDLEGISA